MSAANSAYGRICDELAALREQMEQMKEAIQQQLEDLQTVIDAYVDAVMACCMDMVNGGDCDPHDVEINW